MPTAAMALAKLVEQIARELSDRDDADALPLGQWAVLRYVKLAGAAGRTVAATTNYLGAPDITVRRAVGALARKGLLVELKSPGGGSRLALTAEASRVMKRDPVQRIARALMRLSAEDQKTLSRLVEQLFAGIVIEPP